MKLQIFAILSALFAGGVLGQTFEVNGGNPVTIRNSDAVGLDIPITLKTAHSSAVVVFFDTSATLKMKACQLTFPAYSAGQTQSITVYPASDIDFGRAYQVTMTIFLTTAPGGVWGQCIISWLPIVLTPVYLPPITDQKWCTTTGLHYILGFDGANFETPVASPSPEGYTMFQTVDKVTVIQVWQYSGGTTWNAKLAIKHYDSLLLMDAPDLFSSTTFDPATTLIPGQNTDTLTYYCKPEDNVAGSGTKYRRVNCQIYLSGGIVVYVNWNYLSNPELIYGYFSMVAPTLYQNKVSGFCGNYNGIAGDDGFSAAKTFSWTNPECLNGWGMNSPAFKFTPRTQNGISFAPLGSSCPANFQPDSCTNLITFQNKCNA